MACLIKSLEEGCQSHLLPFWPQRAHLAQKLKRGEDPWCLCIGKQGKSRVYVISCLSSFGALKRKIVLTFVYRGHGYPIWPAYEVTTQSVLPPATVRTSGNIPVFLLCENQVYVFTQNKVIKLLEFASVVSHST